MLLALALALSLTGCAGRVDLPTITPDAGHLHLTGKFVWFDLHATDLAAAGRFYDHVFNWSLKRTDEDSPLVKDILFKGRSIGNIFHLEPGQGVSRWVSCMSVPDVDSAYAMAVKAGARGSGPLDMPNRGRMAEIRDPGMASVALLTSPVGDPRDLPLQNGYWLGSELWVGDVEAARDFYTRLAGYESASMVLADGGLYVMFIGNGRPRGGVTAIPLENAGPQWVPQVAVLDIRDTLAKVEAHGGTVLIRPRMEEPSGRVAVFADPLGAVIGVREFIPPED